MIRTLALRRARPLAAAIVVGLAATPLLLASPPAGASSSAADKQIAKAGVLTAADLGAGWTSKPYKSSGDSLSDAKIKKLASCRTVMNSPIFAILQGKAKKGVEIHSPQFSRGGVTVSNDTTILPNASLATQGLSLVSSPAFSGCLQGVGNLAAAKVRKQLGAQATAVTAQVSPSSLQLGGDQEAGLVMVLSAQLVNGAVVQAPILFDVVRFGRGVNGYTIEKQPQATGTVSTTMLAPSLQRLRTALTN